MSSRGIEETLSSAEGGDMSTDQKFVVTKKAVEPTRDELRAAAKAAAIARAQRDPSTICPNVPRKVVAFAGDWHGNTMWAGARMQSLGEEGIKLVLHVGDFGIWPGPSGKRYLDVMNKIAEKYDMTIMVTPGNHEDWARLDSLKPKDRGDGWGAVQWLTDRIGVFPRAHRFEIEVADSDGNATGVKRSFVSLGGAPSIDYEMRQVGKSWWPTEAITGDDVEKTVAGGHADIMIAHDSPDEPYCVPAVGRILASPSGWSYNGLAYAAVGRRRMHAAYMGVEPKVFVHGHFHVPGVALVEHRGLTMNDEGGNKDARGIVVALDADGTNHNIIRFDLDAMEFLYAKVTAIES
jgi:hypothetical protein